MTTPNKDFLLQLFAAVLLYASVIIYQGYQYGQSDQTQILPVLYEQDHPGTYPKDHYVHTYLDSKVNERTIFHAMLRHMGYASPAMVFFWHALASIALLIAWIRIAGLYIRNKALQWTCLGLLLTIGFHTATGSNEIYYNQFVPSLPAKAFASWAIYYWLKQKYWHWSILLLPAVLLQPLVGLQVFMITIASLGIDWLRKKETKQLPMLPIALYLIITLPWIVLLAKNNGGQTDPAKFMDIIHFRLWHHFFGFNFRSINIILTFIFSIVCLSFYKGKLRWMFATILLGILVYEIGVEYIRSPLILYTQWWKTSIWIEAFAFIAVFSFFEEKFNLEKKFVRFNFLFPLLFLIAVAVYRLSGIFSALPEYSAPLSHKPSDGVDISQKAKGLTPDTALFIIPYDLTSFRWHSHRSNYIDWKAMLHNETFLYEWYDRVSEIYGFDMKAQEEGQTISGNSSAMLSDPGSEIVARWKSLGITHVIGYPGKGIGMELLARNGTYALYRLP